MSNSNIEGMPYTEGLDYSRLYMRDDNMYFQDKDGKEILVSYPETEVVVIDNDTILLKHYSDASRQGAYRRVVTDEQP